MRKFQCLLYVLKWSYIFYYTIYMTILFKYDQLLVVYLIFPYFSVQCFYVQQMEKICKLRAS